MIITTSNSVDGRRINGYLGVVAAAKIGRLGISVKKAEQLWENGVAAVIDVLKEQANKIGADAIIAVSFQSSVDGNQIRATGTAVKLD